MTHTEKICEYIKINIQNNISIERNEHAGAAGMFLEKQCRIHSPGVIVKAGLGKGDLVLELAEMSKTLIVIEPEISLIKDFFARYSEDPRIEKTRFVNGDLHNLPLDWYCGDMIVCVDYLDFHNIALVLDEFKRISEFEGVLVLAGTVLHADDIDGLYDELFRRMMPLHNDFYIPDDLRTVLALKHFKFLDNSCISVPVHIPAYKKFGTDFVEETGGSEGPDSMEYMEENRDFFENMYGYKDNTLTELYEISVYRSEKPEKKEYEEEVAEYTRKLGRSQ